MNAIVTGFICVIVLAALMIAWIAYCMFYKERHKSQVQYDISDLKIKNYELAQKENKKKKKVKGKKSTALAAGIFILPSRHKQNDDYEKRPDYPESPVRDLQPGGGFDKLIDVFNDSTGTDASKDEKDSEMKNACNAPYHSDV